MLNLRKPAGLDSKTTGALALSWILLGACGTDSSTSGAALESRPNIILILADDAGLGDFSCYGNTRLQTPNVDRLALEGMRFTQHYAGSPFCAPTRCSLLTGKHSGRATVRGNNLLRIGKGETTLAEVFQAKGYATTCIGKWGLGDGNSGTEPLQHGFESYLGLTNQQLFEERYFPEFLLRDGEPVALPGNSLAGRQTYAPDYLLEAALEFIREHQEQPFFLYLPFFLPHGPYDLPSLARQQAAKELRNLDADSTELAYAAMITRIDDHLGLILDELARLELDQRTMLLFTSDNGATADGIDPTILDSNLGQRGHKGQLFEGGIRAPLIVRWPGHVQAGSLSDHPSAFWDYLPTMAALLNIEAPRSCTGISFLPTLLGDPQAQRKHEYLYWELSEPELPNRPRGMQALRLGRWKGVRLNVTHDIDAKIMLFDLNSDAGESRDVANEHPNLVDRMARAMRSAHHPNKRFPLLPSEVLKHGNGAWKTLRFQ